MGTPKIEKRHKVEEREQFTDAQKDKIMKKSDYKCVWCGKKCFIGFEGTVDHFVPLKKGGTNDMVNLVLMCKDCNQIKSSKVAPTNVAAIYLKQPYLKELDDYFDKYVETYDYVSRGNLMACDIYEIYFIPEVLSDVHVKFAKKGKKYEPNIKGCSHLLKRAYPDDNEKLTEYYIKYLTKYNQLGSAKLANENIKFWLKFGCIYYIEKDSEIKCMSAVTVNKHGYISFTLFSYYSTKIAGTIARGIVSALTDAIIKENKLLYLPISVNILKDDSIVRRVNDLQHCKIIDGRLACQPCFTFCHDLKSLHVTQELAGEAIDNYKFFLDRFTDVEDKIQLYLYENNLLEDMSWMTDEITGRRIFDDKYYEEAKKYVKDNLEIY